MCLRERERERQEQRDRGSKIPNDFSVWDMPGIPMGNESIIIRRAR